MDSKSLMIGDWVNHLNNPRRIKGAVDFTFANDFDPIPLTAEILEKNGLEHPLPKIEYYDRLAEGKQLVIEKSLKRGHIRFGGCSNYVSNVHELQHALRLCGLNDLADNFKI